jgi:hypothetical protein
MSSVLAANLAANPNRCGLYGIKVAEHLISRQISIRLDRLDRSFGVVVDCD